MTTVHTLECGAALYTFVTRKHDPKHVHLTANLPGVPTQTFNLKVEDARVAYSNLKYVALACQ